MSAPQFPPELVEKMARELCKRHGFRNGEYAPGPECYEQTAKYVLTLLARQREACARLSDDCCTSPGCCGASNANDIRTLPLVVEL